MPSALKYITCPQHLCCVLPPLLRKVISSSVVHKSSSLTSPRPHPWLTSLLENQPSPAGSYSPICLLCVTPFISPLPPHLSLHLCKQGCDSSLFSHLCLLTQTTLTLPSGCASTGPLETTCHETTKNVFPGALIF